MHDDVGAERRNGRHARLFYAFQIVDSETVTKECTESLNARCKQSAAEHGRASQSRCMNEVQGVPTQTRRHADMLYGMPRLTHP